jgi:thiol:disulfide interchange protein DsbC
MKKLVIFFFCLVTIAFSFADDITSSIKVRLKADLPELKVDEVNTTPIKGVYEVVSGRKVFYVGSTGQYAILGNFVDLDTKQSLTEKKVKSLATINWNDLPLKIAIRQTIGKGRRRIAVFTDPDCPFCKRLEQDTISKLKDVVVYYYLYPLKIHVSGEMDAKKILCAENPDATFLSWMTLGVKLPTKTSCKKSANLTTMQKAGRDIVGVEAVPTIVLPNGQLITGLVPADYLGKLITDTSGVAPEDLVTNNLESKAK